MGGMGIGGSEVLICEWLKPSAVERWGKCNWAFRDDPNFKRRGNVTLSILMADVGNRAAEMEGLESNASSLADDLDFSIFGNNTEISGCVFVLQLRLASREESSGCLMLPFCSQSLRCSGNLTALKILAPFIVSMFRIVSSFVSLAMIPSIFGTQFPSSWGSTFGTQFPTS